MWLCKSIKKEKRKKGSKRWISVPANKTMGTSMPASHSNEKKKKKRENKDSPCFPTKSFKEGVIFKEQK